MIYSSYQDIHLIMEAFAKMKEAPHFATAFRVLREELSFWVTIPIDFEEAMRLKLSRAERYEDAVEIRIDPEGLYHVFCLIEDSLPVSYDIVESFAEIDDIVDGFIKDLKAGKNRNYSDDINGNGWAY